MGQPPPMGMGEQLGGPMPMPSAVTPPPPTEESMLMDEVLGALG